MNDVERKQWLINRTEYVLRNYLEELQAEKHQLANFSNKYLFSYRTIRNTILVGVGFTATLLLTLASIGSIQRPITETFLIIDLLVGLVFFVTINLHTYKVDTQFNQIEKVFLNTISIINYVKSVVVTKTVHLDQITNNQLETLFIYNVVVVGAARVELFDKLKQTSKLVWDKHDKKELDSAARIQKRITDDAYQTYNDRVVQFMQEEEFLATLSPLIEPLLKRYQKHSSSKTA